MYRDWSGYYAVSAYEAHHEHEYSAIRNASALIDVSPLFKCLVQRARRRQAGRSRHHPRRVASWPSARCAHTPWCDERGKVIDDGTVTRIESTAFRWTAADPSLRWFTQNAIGLDVDDRGRLRAGCGARAAGSDLRPVCSTAVADADIRSLK